MAARPWQARRMTGTTAGRTGLLHHVELWVPDLDRAVASWGWLLAQLGYARFQEFLAGSAGGWVTRTWWPSSPPR